LIFVLLILLLLPICRPVFAQEERLLEGPVTIEADRISYDREKDTYLAEGHVVIRLSLGILRADSVVLERIANTALATGHVFLQSDGDILEGERVEFDISRKTGVVSEGRLFVSNNHLYVRGARIEKRGEATYRIQQARATTCDGDRPDWQLTGRELNVTVDGYGTLRGGKFLVKDVPVLYIPYLLFPAKKTRQTGFLFPRIGYSSNKDGWDVELPFYWAIARGADATFFQRYMEKRGFQEGVEFRYVLGENSFGTLYGDYMHDNKEVSETLDNRSREWDSKDRWSYYLNHETRFGQDLYFRADVVKVSDSWYFRDFSSQNYFSDHYSTAGDQRFKRVSFVGNESLPSLDSKMRLVKDWPLYNLTILGQYTDNFATPGNAATLQQYPEIALTGIRRPLLGTPLLGEFGASYDYYYRSEGQKGHLYDFKPTFSLPFHLLGAVKVVPFAGLQGTFWDRNDKMEDGYEKQGDRELYHAGVHLSTEAFRVFNMDRQSLEKIRHGIKPEVIYSFTPFVHQDDRPDFVAGIDERNQMTFALTNTLMGRFHGEKGETDYRDLLRLKLAQTYDIREASRNVLPEGKQRRPFGDLDMELDLTPLNYLSLQARHRFSPNSGEWKQTDYEANLRDGRGDSLSLEYRYTQDMVEGINLTLKTVLMKSLDIAYTVRKNELDDQTVDNALSVRFYRQCWDFKVTYSDANGDRRFMVAFSLLGAGRIGGR
jgi:LPS-assembly protein